MNIKELRLEFNLSQQQLSDRVGIPKGRINSWEQRNTTPKVEDYRKLENFFNILREQMYSTESIPFDKKDIPLDNFSQVQESSIQYSAKGQFIRGTDLAGVARENMLQEKIAFLEQRLKDKEELITELKYTITVQKETIETLKESFSRKDSTTLNPITQK